MPLSLQLLVDLIIVPFLSLSVLNSLYWMSRFIVGSTLKTVNWGDIDTNVLSIPWMEVFVSSSPVDALSSHKLNIIDECSK